MDQCYGYPATLRHISNDFRGVVCAVVDEYDFGRDSRADALDASD